MTAVNRRARRHKGAIAAALLAPLALLAARRAVRAAALRRNESRRAPHTHGRAGTVRPTAAAATSAPVGPTPAAVESAGVGRARGLPIQSEATRPAELSAAGLPKRKGRTRRLALAAASVALIGVFIQHAQSRVPRPTLVLERPTTVSSATHAGLRSDAVPKSPATVVRPRTRGGVPASTAPAPRRPVTRASSETRASSQKLHQHHPKHQSRAVRASGRRPARPVLPAKRARERPVAPVHAGGGRALRRLQWNAVARATYYNLVLWRDGKRVLDLWPTSPRVVVPATSVNHGPLAHLSPGRYLWFVYPGFGAKPAQKYGALAGTGVLVVQPKGGQ
jgi:hypothetical protein